MNQEECYKITVELDDRTAHDLAYPHIQKDLTPRCNSVIAVWNDHKLCMCLARRSV